MKPKITKEEFITQYCENSKFSRAFFDKWYEAKPCPDNCDYEDCEGWGAYINQERLEEEFTELIG
jgi:hypothetical protein